MNIADVVIVVVLLFNVLLGYSEGLLKSLKNLLITGLSIALTPAVARFAQDHVSMEDLLSHSSWISEMMETCHFSLGNLNQLMTVLCFLACCLVLTILFGAVINPFVGKGSDAPVGLSRLFGAACGLLTGAFRCYILMIALSLTKDLVHVEAVGSAMDKILAVLNQSALQPVIFKLVGYVSSLRDTLIQ